MAARLRPLSKSLRPFFDRLDARLNVERPPKPIHPLDRICLYQFVNRAHERQPALSPLDFHRHLLAADVDDDRAESLRTMYELGRQLLACTLHPWGHSRRKLPARLMRPASPFAPGLRRSVFPVLPYPNPSRTPKTRQRANGAAWRGAELESVPWVRSIRQSRWSRWRRR